MKKDSLEELNKIRNNIIWFRDVYDKTNPRVVAFTYNSIKNRLYNIRYVEDYDITEELSLLDSIYTSKLEIINKTLTKEN